MSEFNSENLGERFKKDGLLNILDKINVSALLNVWGPMTVMQVYNPELNMQGILVIDNIALGPGCGRVRISPTVTPKEIYSEARVMTWSSALSDIRLGGAAGGISADPSKIDKNDFIRSFARKVSPYVPDKFIAAPGKGIGKEEIKAFVDEIGDTHGACGKPKEMGGIPFETGVIGFGIGVAIESCLKVSSGLGGFPVSLSEARIAIHGFNKDNCKLAKFLSNKGATIVGLSDDECTIYNAKGLDVKRLSNMSATDNKQSDLKYYKDAKVLSRNDIAKLKCDILVCTSPSSCIEENIKKIKAKLVVEGDCNSISSISDQIMIKQGLFVLPDIITIAAVPISSYAEVNKLSCERTFSMIETKVKEVTKKTLQRSIELGIPLRRMAKEMAKERILHEMEAT